MGVSSKASGVPVSETTVSETTAVETKLVPASRKLDLAFTTAIAFPQPLTIGIQGHRENQPYLDAFYEGGFFKYPITAATRSFNDYSMAVGLRYHPFHNWFYTSAAIGFRHVGLSVDISNLKQDGVALANTATLSMGTFFVGLMVGGEWKFTQSFGLAFDLGMQLALLHTGGIQIKADPAQDDGTDLSVDDSKEMSRISGLPLPQIAIFRFIWYI